MPNPDQGRSRERRKPVPPQNSGKHFAGRTHHGRNADLLPGWSSRSVVLVLLLLTLVMFWDVLFTSRSVFLSSAQADLYHQFLDWREFGFHQLRQGNLALWNPHIYSGTPYFAGFQSALLYPLNFVYLLLPLARAVNLGIVLHVFLAGMFMYLWASYRGLHPLAGLLSAVLFMFCGAHFLHVYAGHLPNLCTMVWFPLIMLAIDGVLDRASLGFLLLGLLAVSMQLLAGHPQYVFYSAIAAAVYCGLRLFRAPRRLRSVLLLVAINAGAICLTAVQLWTGVQASREYVRGGGVAYEFAAMFSFPPENLITLLAPGFFGDLDGLSYWGRCYLWEMTLFFSVTGLGLALVGAIWGERAVRRFSLCMVLLLMVLALGAHTPVFRLLYDWAPGFNQFRGSSKFILQASVFLVLLAGIGLDFLIRRRALPKGALYASLALAAALAAGAAAIQFSAASGSPGSWWGRVMGAASATGESYLPPESLNAADFVKRAGERAAGSVAVSAGLVALFTLCIWKLRRARWVLYLLPLLGAVEVFIFARNARATFELSGPRFSELRQFYAERPGDYRVLNLLDHNSAMTLGQYDLWGYDPGVLRRYAEFMAAAQGLSPQEAGQYLQFSRFPEIFAMLRCRFVLVPEGGSLKVIQFDNVMPRLSLIQDWVLESDKTRVLDRLMQRDFDPRSSVVLESPPDPAPAGHEGGGTVKLIDSSTDHLTVEASLSQPAILLITDAYSPGWRVTPLVPSAQERYSILPANYALRAIPLAAGFHRLRIEYRPMAFIAGRWVSLLSLLGYCVLFGYWVRAEKYSW